MARSTRRNAVAVGLVCIAVVAVGFVFVMGLGFALGFAGFATGLHNDELAVTLLAWSFAMFVVVGLSSWITGLGWTLPRIVVTSLLAVATQFGAFVLLLESPLHKGGLALAALLGSPALVIVAGAALWPGTVAPIGVDGAAGPSETGEVR
jgi:hypothetical protein